MIKDVKNPKDLKCLKKPSLLQKLKLKNKMGISLAAIALALGIGSFSLLGKNDTLTMGITKDIAEDKYENSIPLFFDKEGKKLLTTIDNKKLIITLDNVNDSDKNDELHLISTINENDEMVTGYTYKKYMSQLTEIDKETSSNLYRVTSDNGIFLRSSPELKDNKLLSIPSDTILIGSKPQEDKMLWTNVLYYNGATISKGYASGKFLEKVSDFYDVITTNHAKKSNDTTTKSFENESTKNITELDDNNVLDHFSPQDNLVGIDISYMSPNILDKLLNGDIKLSDVVENKFGKKTDISRYDKHIDYVFFKVLGTQPLSKSLKKEAATPYKEFAEICEKNNIPFGVYISTTCTNIKEAKQEYQWLSESLEDLHTFSQFLLPVVLNVEVGNNKDRQYSVSKNTLTDSKIALANMIEKDFGRTILYVPRNAYDERLNSRILDLEQYQNGLNNGKSDIWHVAPLHNKLHREALERTSKTEPITMKQIALDVKVNKNNNDLVDINLMSAEALENYISGRYNFSDGVYGKKGAIYFTQNDRDER